MNLRRLSMLTALVALAGAAPSAFADTINYSFSAFGETATFSLPSNPTPSVIGSDYFQINNVTVNVSGFGTITGNLDFFDTAGGGGAGTGSNILNGPQLFSGSLSTPTLLTGTFALSGTVTPDSDGPVSISGTLDATSSVTPPVPEPSSIVLLLTGIGSLGAAAVLRRRHSTL